jgi:diacylglycerol kinase (ATP)
MEKISFILHGKIRGRKTVKSTLISRFSVDYDVRFYETAHPRHAEKLTSQALTDGCDYLIAVGGDGTLNEVVNAFLKDGGMANHKVVLGVLPYGTGNDFARGLGITRDVDQISELIKGKKISFLDAGSMEFRLPDGTVNTRYFDNIADLGIGADVVLRVNGVNLRKKILGGTLTFFLSVLATFMSYKPKRIRVSWDGFDWEGKVLSLVVANGRYFGSGLGVAPEASMTDGLFDIVIFADLSILDYLKNYSRVRNLKKVNHPEAFYYRANRLSIEPAGNLTIVEADGEIEGQAPIVFTCLPGALPFLVP